jgi:hypothetical protein
MVHLYKEFFQSLGLPYVRHDSAEDVSPMENPSNDDRSADVIINFRNEDNRRENDTREPANFNINQQTSEANNQSPARHSNVDTSIVQEEEWDELSIQNVLKRYIFTILKWNTISLFFFVFLLVAIQWNLSYLYPIVFLWLVDVYNVVSIIHTFSETIKLYLSYLNNKK